MADLVAQGQEPTDRWRRPLPKDQEINIGRTAQPWATPWDSQVSRTHATLRWDGSQLHVNRIKESRNPIFVDGEETTTFQIRPGDHFVIGQTRFTLEDAVAVTVDSPQPVAEQTFSSHYLKKVHFRDGDQRITILGRLPELIAGAGSERELCIRVVNVLLSGVGRATAAAIVAGVPPNNPLEASSPTAPEDDTVADETGSALIEGNPLSNPKILHWDHRPSSPNRFQPSSRLIQHALAAGESTVHVWSRPDKEEAKKANFTMSEAVDWSFCIPIGGTASQNLALYVSGGGDGGRKGSGPRPEDPQDLRDDLKFTEIVANALRGYNDVQMLERRQQSLRQFFSPVVLDALAGKDPAEVLAAREVDAAVLFCDLRGFSRTSEEAQDLLALLNRVSLALGVMTSAILESGGVVGDFHGDAAMGFWGWPIEQPDAIDRAVSAALAIRRQFAAAATDPKNPLHKFRVGIGVAAGRAVAGKIGTIDQVKVTVFGPVVNLASRLEGMTKQLGAPILVDSVVSERIRQSIPKENARVRKVAVVTPYGLTQPVEVSELLPPMSEHALLSDTDIEAYERALAAFVEGDWAAAFQLLHHVPAEDRVKDFLTFTIAQHHRTPPSNFDGTIPLEYK
jgi:adenylate cyclase